MSVETTSIAGLLAAALGGENDETSWLAIRELQKRATPPAFEAACALCADSDPVRRSCGAKILSEFGYAGWSGEDLSSACAGALLPLLEDIDENVRFEGARALSKRKDNRCLPILIAMTSHPELDTRWSVVNALGRFDDRAATDAVIGMTRDNEKLIRDWATFALGSLTDADYPELRDALFARIGDADSATRGEALRGLAARRDDRIWPALDHEIRSLDPDDENGDMVLDCCLDAVESLKHPRLIAPLEAVSQSLDETMPERWGERIQNAIAVCKTEAS